MAKKGRTAVIIGAGPAGLTAAYELLTRTDIKPIVIEQNPRYVGGIARTEHHNGNRIDIGGHRFYTKSDRVMAWWASFLPVKQVGDATISYQRSSRDLGEGLRRATEADGERVLQVTPRKTRIIYKGKFFTYPVELSLDTLVKLGPIKVLKIGVTYLWVRLFPKKPEVTLEDFFINRFGQELYETFFKSYTEKVWGVPCTVLSAEWGAQRVKGLSISKAIAHTLKKLFAGGAQTKKTETSLIERFLYPTHGPGMLWEVVAESVKGLGGEIRMGVSATSIAHDGVRASGVTVRNADGTEETLTADLVFSTTDIKALGHMLAPTPPAEVLAVSDALPYRDFMIVGLLLSKRPTEHGVPLTDTWIYVHEPGVKVGRVELFYNWSAGMIKDQSKAWIGLEYFCEEGDTLWSMADKDLIALASKELETIGIRQGATVEDAVVIRQPKAYPSYFGAYSEFPIVRDYLKKFENLYPLGRNGMHRYNNQDHSMLAAMTAVDLIAQGSTDKDPIWSVNTDDEYGEEKK